MRYSRGPQRDAPGVPEAAASLSFSKGVPVFLDSLQLDRLASTKLYSRDEEGIIAFLSSNFSRRKISVTIEKATTLYTREKHTVAQCRSAFRRVRRWNRTVIRMIYTRLERGVLPRGGVHSFLFPSSKHKYLLVPFSRRLFRVGVDILPSGVVHTFSHDVIIRTLNLFHGE